jgi:hypothetical protein
VEVVAAAQLSVQAGLGKVVELVHACARKWKDASRAVPVKLGMMQGACGMFVAACL